MVVLEVIVERLLALESEIDLLFELLSLLTGHKLLGVLIRISKLAAAFDVEVFLWAVIALSGRLMER